VSGLGLNIDPATIITIAVFLLVAFPIHEFFHALAAYRLGDSTAKYYGRLSLNPIVHFDPIGGGLLAITMLMGTFVFGWAKPTPVNPMNLRNGHRGEAVVALAGPASNVLMAFAAAIPMRFMIMGGMLPTDFTITPFWSIPAEYLTPELLVGQVLGIFVYVNVILAIFNLLPVPPLDGSKLLYGVLDARTAHRIRPVLDQYGFLILIVLILPIFGGQSILGAVVSPLIDAIYGLLVGR
jgi:Zn-dependent protease